MNTHPTREQQNDTKKTQKTEVRAFARKPETVTHHRPILLLTAAGLQVRHA